MNSVRFNNTLITPSKVLCVGRNYVDHIKELNNVVPDQMVVFNKPNSAITATLCAKHDEPLHYETEICLVVQGGQYVGVGLGLDLTKRQLQSKLKQKGLPWERAKAFNGSAVFSKFIALDHIDITELKLELLINCVRVQNAHVSQMIYSPQMILEELATFTTLEDNDVVMTGTPQGVGEVHAGDAFLARLKEGDTTLIEIEWIAQ